LVEGAERAVEFTREWYRKAHWRTSRQWLSWEVIYNGGELGT